jgi:hypothetical protein
MARGLLQAVTANRLGDGEVVYLAPDGRWSERLDDCRLTTGEAAGADLMEAAAEAERTQIVIGAYLIDLDRHGDSLRPARLRESVRVRGPTVRRDLGKQAT